MSQLCMTYYLYKQLYIRKETKSRTLKTTEIQTFPNFWRSKSCDTGKHGEVLVYKRVIEERNFNYLSSHLRHFLGLELTFNNLTGLYIALNSPYSTHISLFKFPKVGSSSELFVVLNDMLQSLGDVFDS